jgi:ribosome biogenesis GTPase A
MQNAFKGKKYVSVSRTPGHTKHFQTIFLSDTVRLCDCPGLVFPSLIPKEIQILSGIYNIAQVQEPLSCIRFLAERIPLIEQLKLNHYEEDEDEFQWSPWTISEAFAFQKGFLNAKSGRPDVHRGANLILRMNFDGRILLSFRPPGFSNVLNAVAESPFSPRPNSSSSSQEEPQAVSKAEKKRRRQLAKKNQLSKLTGSLE